MTKTKQQELLMAGLWRAILLKNVDKIIALSKKLHQRQERQMASMFGDDWADNLELANASRPLSVYEMRMGEIEDMGMAITPHPKQAIIDWWQGMADLAFKESKGIRLRDGRQMYEMTTIGDLRAAAKAEQQGYVEPLPAHNIVDD